MLQRAHRLQSDKTWIEESKNQIKALKLELKDKLEKFNKDVDAFELLKKQDSAYEPSEPVQSNAQDVSELKAQVEKLQKLLDLQKLALIDAQKASSSSAVNVTPPAQGARSTLKERLEEKKHKPFKHSLLDKLSLLAKSTTIQRTQICMANYLPYQGVKKEEKAQKMKSKEKKSKKKKSQLQVKTKKRVRVSDDESGSLSESDDVNVDLDSCSESECESEKEGVAVEIISLSSIVSDAEFKKRVKSCPILNKENLFPGRKLAKFFEQGWCVGEIVCFRPKRVRSNVTIQWKDEPVGCQRDHLLVVEEYREGRGEISDDVDIGCWFFYD
jgi:hypothetical protein